MNGTSDNIDSLNDDHLRMIVPITAKTNVNPAHVAVPLLGTTLLGLGVIG